MKKIDQIIMKTGIKNEMLIIQKNEEKKRKH